LTQEGLSTVVVQHVRNQAFAVAGESRTCEPRMLCRNIGILILGWKLAEVTATQGSLALHLGGVKAGLSQLESALILVKAETEYLKTV
jgi:hypothetical protein